MEQLVAIEHEWEVRLTLRTKYGAPQEHISGPFKKRSVAEAVAEKLSEQDGLLSVTIVDVLAEREAVAAKVWNEAMK